MSELHNKVGASSEQKKKYMTQPDDLRALLKGVCMSYLGLFVLIVVAVLCYWIVRTVDEFIDDHDKK